jgi:serine/threonine-protein kinase
MIQGLDRARWAVLNPLLDEALELAVAARPAWLAALRERDPALGGDIEELLSEYGRVAAEDFLGTPLAPLATLAGQAIGAYTLQEPIGRGGMGSVWLAHRSDGRFEGAVAVKLLNASLMGPGAEHRFRREGSILARLRHPHIAQLFDAGVSPSGQPYLVLEHVDGEHIGVHCDRLRLSVEARVRLFLDVLAAVAHAHANLIVHRDLKPSNVLVRRDGVVKLLDFGVAKLLTPDSEPATLTLEGTALTPEYAAPEQLQGGDITTATDVFALGVLLYVLLAGRHPAGDTVSAAPADLIRTLLDREPARLSAVAIAQATESDGGRSRAMQRGVTPEALGRALRGDLETIVAKALKKEPAERYASVAALADDLRRHLDHAPISARPDTFTYRATRFVQRYRLPVALSGALLIALLTGLAGTLWEARAAARQRDLALVKVDRAEEINDFNTFLLADAPAGAAVSFAELLHRAEVLGEKRAKHDPALVVDVLVNVGEIYASREEPDNARRALARAYKLSQTVADPATRARAACAWARSVSLGSNDPTEALRLIDEGLAFTTTEATFDGVVVTCLLARGAIGITQNTAELASVAGQQALDRLDRRPEAFPALRASALQTIAAGRKLAGETSAADRAFARAYEQYRLVGQEDSTNAATLISNWATNTAGTDPLASLEQNRRAIDLTGSLENAALPRLLNYALQLRRLARDAEARAVLERAVTVAERDGHVQLGAVARLRLAESCRELGDRECARDALRTAADLVSNAYPPGHRVRGDLAREQALAAESEGRDADAHRLLLEACAVHSQLKDRNPTQIETLLQLSRLELRLRSTAAAESRAREALALADGLRDEVPHSSWVGRSLLALGAALQAQGDATGARPLLTQAVAHMTPTLGAGHPDLAEAQRRLSGSADPLRSSSVGR